MSFVQWATEAVFGRAQTPQEMIEEHKRVLRKSGREMQREREQMQRQEKTLVSTIKATAKQGQMAAARVQAANLVRLRNHIATLYRLGAQVDGVLMQVGTMGATAKMADAMKGMARAVGAVNSQMSVTQLQGVLRDFEKQGMQMDMKMELMNDSIDGAMTEDGDEQSADNIIDAVLAEIGIDVSGKMANVPAAPATTGTVLPAGTGARISAATAAAPVPQRVAGSSAPASDAVLAAAAATLAAATEPDDDPTMVAMQTRLAKLRTSQSKK